MRRARTWLWSGALAIAIALLLPFRDRMDKAHVTLVLLLVVLSAAAEGGRRAGLVTALLAFLGFNWFFLPPYSTLVIADPLDWGILLAFLGTSVIASHLFHRVQRAATAERERTAEMTRLATLGAQAMTAPRAEGALHEVAATTRDALAVDRCRVHVVVEPRAGASEGAAGRIAQGDRSAAITTVAADGKAPADGTMEPVRLALDRAAPVAVLAGGGGACGGGRRAGDSPGPGRRRTVSPPGAAAPREGGDRRA